MHACMVLLNHVTRNGDGGGTITKPSFYLREKYFWSKPVMTFNDPLVTILKLLYILKSPYITYSPRIIVSKFDKIYPSQINADPMYCRSGMVWSVCPSVCLSVPMNTCLGSLDIDYKMCFIQISREESQIVHNCF